MKPNLTLALTATALVSLFVTSVANAQMNYQGRLTDDAGVVDTAGTADLTFNIYNVPVSGSALWGPFTFTGVELINGRFNVVLPSSDGSAPNLATALAGTAYIHITVNGNAGLPRQQIYAAPKALNAELATHAGTASNFVSGVLYTRDFTGGNWNTEDGLTQGTERVGIGTQQPSAKLDVNGGALHITSDGYGFRQKTLNGSTEIHAFLNAGQANFGTLSDDPLYLVTNANTVNMALLSNGDVGIGTTAPATRLHVDGSADASLTTHGLFVTGPTSGSNLVMDGNEILARNGTSTSQLHLQNDGGDLSIGNSSSTTTLNGEVKFGHDVVQSNNAFSGVNDHDFDVGDPSTTAGPWIIYEVNCSKFANAKFGFKVRIFMQHEVNFDIRNYEGTIALERDGYANHPNFDSNVYRWGTVQSRVGGEVNFRLGNPVGADNHDFKTLSNNGWVNVYNFEPLSLTGGSNQSFIPPLPYFYFACHPHVSGHVTISFN